MDEGASGSVKEDRVLSRDHHKILKFGEWLGLQGPTGIAFVHVNVGARITAATRLPVACQLQHVFDCDIVSF